MSRFVLPIFLFALLFFPLDAVTGEPVFFPAPQEMEWDGATSAEKTFALKTSGGVPASVVREWRTGLKKWGFQESGDGVVFSLSRLPIAECEAAATQPYQKRVFLDYSSLQTYFLKTGGDRVEVGACGEDGFFYALLTFGNLWEDSGFGISLHKVDIVDYPDFPVRGIFEGGYGGWDLEGRLRVIDWMGGVKLNSYLYGPKGDPKIRRRWRELYDDIELFGFKRMLERMKENHIQPGYVIAPTLGMEYGSDEDFETLLRKVRQMQSLGIKSFALAFDDTMGMLYHPRDRKKFDNLGEAEAFLANRLYEALRAYDEEVVVAIVPEIYSGVHEMDYTRSLAETLLPEIYIGWTGDEIVAPKMDADSMKAFIDFYGRMPSLGDNWGTIFPLLARHADIHEYTTQFLVNPYNLQGEMPLPGVESSSEPQLMPVEGAAVAEFGWNPHAYGPEETIAKIAKLYFKPEAREVFKLLMYRESRWARGYISQESGYAPPPEKEARALLVNKDMDRMKEFVKNFGPVLDDAVNGEELVRSGCLDRRMGDALAKRARGAVPYFKKLRGELLGLKEGIKQNDPEMREQAIKAFIEGLRGKQ